MDILRFVPRVDSESSVRVNTVCIDKSSSAELSESINSMFQWYQIAKVCYAYLPDVSVAIDHPSFIPQLNGSRWFTEDGCCKSLLRPKGSTSRVKTGIS
jgi:hypothetical protein